VPELPEVEAYRRLAESEALGRTVVGVLAPDRWFLKRGLTPEAVTVGLIGRRLTSARRRGKLLLLDSDGDGPVVGVRFGMSGRLVVDGRAGVDRLLYSSGRDVEAWDRFGLDFADGGRLRVRDPRRLGGIELDPDLRRLGPDALGLGPAGVRDALAGSAAPLKARLLDQSRMAGVGNLIADEALWRAGLSPLRPAGSLTPAEVRRLATHLRRTVDDLIAGGGSHTGDLAPARRPGGVCPRDRTPLVRTTVGGRTTWWCPAHQR
jgi:formamidopyrimidine-DNA glycosylase